MYFYSFYEEGYHAEELGTVLASHDFVCEVAAWLRSVIELYYSMLNDVLLTSELWGVID